MEIDLKVLQRLLNHGRIDEVGNGYPTGVDHDAPAAHQDHLQTNGLGDNSMRDPSLEGNTAGKAGAASGDGAVEESADSMDVTPLMMETMKKYLAAECISLSHVAMNDFEVDASGTITIGDQEIDHQTVYEFAVEVTGDDNLAPLEANAVFMDVLEALAEHLDESMGMQADTHQELDEFRADDVPVGSRFAYNVDSLGHVVVTDGETGKSVYLQGSDAIELLGNLERATGEGQVQHLLQQYQHVMEGNNIADFNGPSLDAVAKDLKDTVERGFLSMMSELKEIQAQARKENDIYVVMMADVYLQDLEKFEKSILAKY